MFISINGLSDTYLAIIILLSLVVFLFLIALRLLKDLELAGLIVLCGLLMLLPAAAVLLPLYAAGAAFGVAVILARLIERRRSGRRAPAALPRNFTLLLNVVTGVAALTVIIRMVIFEGAAQNEASRFTAASHSEVRRAASLRAPGTLPHIVHVVLDGYSRADVLKDVYGFDNTPFLAALQQRGFRVSAKASTPFNQTLLVMASIFSLEPVTELLVQHGEKDDDTAFRKILAQIQRAGVVTDVLATLGYDLQSAPTTYSVMEWRGATNGAGGGRLGPRLFAHTVLDSAPLIHRFKDVLPGTAYDVVSANYMNLKEVAARRFQPAARRPLFAYEHIIAPHPPFNITDDGLPKPLDGFPWSLHDGTHLIEQDDTKRTRYREGYIEKLRFINGAILEHIDTLKRTLPGPLIIILHGDHGGGMHYDQDAPSRSCLRERFSPLLAVYASDEATAREFTDDFNLVNIYRVLFRHLLPVDLPNLPDRTVFVPWNLVGGVTLAPGERGAGCGASPKGPLVAGTPAGDKQAEGKGIVNHSSLKD